MKTEDTIIQCIEEVIKGNNEHSVKGSFNKEDDKKYIFNEISLQVELAIILREKLEGYIIQLERNITTFGKKRKKRGKKNLKKSEIDIVIVNKENANEKYAIELKYHKKDNLRLPNTMYDCIKDMVFMKELKDKKKCKATFCVNVVEDEGFYTNEEKVIKRRKSINYIYFRDKISEKDLEEFMKKFDKEKQWKAEYSGEKDNNRNEPLTTYELFKNKKIPVKWDYVEKGICAKYYIIKF